MMKNKIVVNLLLGAAFVAGFILLAALSLRLITRHNRYTTVPDFSGMSYVAAREAAADAGMKVRIEDSVYVKRVPKGGVYSQNPKPGATVKRGRAIDLTLNATSPKMVEMPALVGLSMRQAKAELISRGLQVGKFIYRSDIATNNVLRQWYNGKNIAPGRPIEAGSKIDLVLGLNYEDDSTFIPQLIGLSAHRAVDVLHDNSLNVTSLHYDRAVRTYEDSLAAVVYYQSPETSSEPVKMGTGVSLRLRLPKSK